jgi:dolichyl-phosphate-mannose-protein mannosyltransferase
MPSDWRRDAFIFREDLCAWDTTEAYQGERSVMISIAPGMPNDARWIQTVTVEPHTRYRLKGWIKTVDVAPSGQAVQAGANLSILDVTLNSGFTFSSPPLFGDNDWTQVELEFDSGTHTQLTVAARLGMYSGTLTGTAWFDHIRLVKLEPCE